MCIYNYISIIVSVGALGVSILALIIARKHYYAAIAPEIWSNGFVDELNTTKRLIFVLCNRGNTARIRKIKLKKNNRIALLSTQCPFEILKDEEVKIACNIKGEESIMNVDATLVIRYKDIQGNWHKIKLIKRGVNCYID